MSRVTDRALACLEASQQCAEHHSPDSDVVVVGLPEGEALHQPGKEFLPKGAEQRGTACRREACCTVKGRTLTEYLQLYGGMLFLVLVGDRS